MPLIESVPNLSEGRSSAIIERLAQAILSKGVPLLDISSDPDANRSVFTFAADPQSILAATRQLLATAASLIDLRHHAGVHPRIGVMDVCPFIPLAGTTMADCIRLAHKFGAQVATEYNLPVFMYGAASVQTPERVPGDLRRGGLISLTKRLRTHELTPDFGPAQLHPNLGALLVGARHPLIAFNVSLGAQCNLRQAHKLATILRQHRDGGTLPPGISSTEFPNQSLGSCQAIAWELPSRGHCQISTNILNFHKTSLALVYQSICTLAKQHQITVTECELVGLLPQLAFDAWVQYYVNRPVPKGSENWTNLTIEARLEQVKTSS